MIQALSEKTVVDVEEREGRMPTFSHREGRFGHNGHRAHAGTSVQVLPLGQVTLLPRIQISSSENRDNDSTYLKACGEG